MNDHQKMNYMLTEEEIKIVMYKSNGDSVSDPNDFIRELVMMLSRW